MIGYLGVGSSHDICTYISLFLLYVRITQKQGHYVVDDLSPTRGKVSVKEANSISTSVWTDPAKANQ